MKLRGKLITFEGTEGAGKSTLITALVQLLSSQGVKVIATREPGGAAVAEKIRKIILKEKMNPWTELFLYEAARAEHLHQTILPALKDGAVILCDRFTDSSLAYQAHARGLDWNTVVKLNDIATLKIKPHASVFLDINPKQGLKHATDPNRFEAEGVKFQIKVHQGFMKSIKQSPKRWVKMKARSDTPEIMAKKLWKKLEKKLYG